MEFRKAIEVLINMMNKHSLNNEEKEAILTAIGTLDSGALGKNRIKGIYEKKKNNNV